MISKFRRHGPFVELPDGFVVDFDKLVSVSPVTMSHLDLDVCCRFALNFGAKGATVYTQHIINVTPLPCEKLGYATLLTLGYGWVKYVLMPQLNKKVAEKAEK